MTIPSHHLVLYFIFLTFLQYSFIQSALDPRDAPVYLSHFCSTNKTFTSNSPYHLSLTTLLSSLSSHASGSLEFFNTTVHGGAGATVHGLFLCRGDVTSQVCKTCLAMAIQKLASRCSFSKEAIVWYHECMVRYSNRSFFSAVEDWPRLNLVNSSSIPDSSEHGNVGWFLANTLHEAAAVAAAEGIPAGQKKFATRTGDLSGGSNQKVYCLVQCSPDLRSGDCRRCLEDMMGDIPMCCLGRQGGMVLYPSCSLMFGFRLFYREVEDEHAREARHPSFSTDGDKEDSAAQGERKDKYQRTIVMVVVPVVVPGMLYYFVFYLIRRKSRKRYAILKQNFGNEGTTLESLQYDFATIEAATNRFSYENRIGRGGFGEVYKGTLPNGQKIAVKRLSGTSDQGAVEFKNEVLLIAKLQHRNLVTLLGFCLQDHEKILVYEFVPNKSLDYFLFDSEKQRLLDWPRRFKIIEGIARVILYLHEHSRLKIIHRDLKPSNVLLDDNMNPKLSDFGMARMVAIDQDQGRTRRIVGTYGYMSPEYAVFGKYSEKSDIFSFGVMILEIISGKKSAKSYESPSVDGLLTQAWKQWRDETPLEIIDPNLRESYSETEVSKCIQIGLLCVQENADDRPQMSRVVSYLSNLSVELPFPREPAFYVHSRMEPNMVALESSSGQSTNNSIRSINGMSISTSFPR